MGDNKAFATVKDQKAFEKGLWDKTQKPGGERAFLLRVVLRVLIALDEIIAYESYLVVFKHSADVIFYIVGSMDENELMLQTALTAFYEALQILLKNQVERASILENFDLVMLCLDETLDDG